MPKPKDRIIVTDATRYERVASLRRKTKISKRIGEGAVHRSFNKHVDISEGLVTIRHPTRNYALGGNHARQQEQKKYDKCLFHAAKIRHTFDPHKSWGQTTNTGAIQLIIKPKC